MLTPLVTVMPALFPPLANLALLTLDIISIAPLPSQL